jgi:uncharacterized protein YeaO (DUF488 family)
MKGGGVMIRIKRVYEPASPEDGARWLVERLWPRGMKKEDLAMDGWLVEIAPSTALRQWFAHDPAKWAEFQRRYRRELAANRQNCSPLLDAARRGPLTLLYSARDSDRNSAVVLKAYLEKQIGRPSRRPGRAAGGDSSRRRKTR